MYKSERINDYITNTEIEVVRQCDEDGNESFTKTLNWRPEGGKRQRGDQD